MDRRKFILGIGGASLGGSALIGSGAFSRVESQRDVSIQVAEDPDAYLGLSPMDTPNSDNYVELDENSHLTVEIGENPNDGEGVNSNSQTWFDDLFLLCNQGKEDACVSWTFGDDFEMRDDAELVFYYDGDEDGDPTTEGRVDVEEGREVELPLGSCVEVGLRTETFDVDATLDEPLFDGTIQLIADVDGDCFEEDPTEPQIVTWSEVGREGEAGGPVVLFGLDSELGAGSDDHGPPEEHADMVESVLGSVTNDNDGILVIGAKEDGDVAEQYWREDIAEAGQVDEEITFVNGEDDIREQEFDDFALIGIASSDDELFGGGGLLEDENEAVIDRRGDIADFVNDGGGLIGKTQAGLNNPWEYVDPFGDFIIHEADNSSVEVTDAAKDLTFSQEGLDGWCCYHEVFEWDEDEEGDDAKVGFPDFFEVLIINDESGDNGYRDANAIGGEEVVIEREVSFQITGPGSINVDETESYDVTIENGGDDSIEGEFEFDVVTGDPTVTDTLPDTVELDSGESESWDDAIDVTCNTAGGTEIDVELVDVDDGSRLVEVTMTPECS